MKSDLPPRSLTNSGGAAASLVALDGSLARSDTSVMKDWIRVQQSAQFFGVELFTQRRRTHQSQTITVSWRRSPCGTASSRSGLEALAGAVSAAPKAAIAAAASFYHLPPRVLPAIQAIETNRWPDLPICRRRRWLIGSSSIPALISRPQRRLRGRM